jgi:predicted nucleic acid-binding Zn ribbon protein
MPPAPPEPQVPAAGVHTPQDGPVLGSRPCPVCQKNPLQGGQTACSARCRRERSRQRVADRQQLRDQEVLALLARAETLEARAAELRAQARKHLGEIRE